MGVDVAAFHQAEAQLIAARLPDERAFDKLEILTELGARFGCSENTQQRERSCPVERSRRGDALAGHATDGASTKLFEAASKRTACGP